MSGAINQMPPLHVEGRASFLFTNNPDGTMAVTVVQSPMLSKEEARDFLGMGINAFDERVNDGSIKRRGETRKGRPYHIADLNAYLETLS